MYSQPEEDANLSEQIQILRQDVLNKNLEIVKLQDSQKGRESRSLTESSSAYPRRRLSPERKGVHVSLKDMNLEEFLGTGDADQKKEIETLKSKLKAATDICTQQERHFSKLVKDLEHKLSEAITGRDELLTLRQQESGTQQQLIYQLQAALQQTKQTLELRNEELSDSEKRIKINEEKLSQAQTALVKVHSVLKDEETKRESTNILTGVTSDYHHLYTGDLLTQVLSNFLKEDEAKISDMKLRNQEVERQLQEIKDFSKSDKVRLIREYESKFVNLEKDHAKSLDIAANRTLTERNRTSELLRDIEESRLRYEKTISDHERIISSLEENVNTCRAELDEKTKQHEIQHDRDVTVLEEMQNQLENLKREKVELLHQMHEKTTAQTSYGGNIILLEGQIEELTLKLESAETNYKDIENELLGNISQLEKTLKEKEEKIKCMKEEHEEELGRKSDRILHLEKSEGSDLFKKMEKNHSESIRQISALKEELRQKTNEVLKFMEECRTLRDKIDTMDQEKSAVFQEKEELVRECETLSKKILSLQEEKSNLSNMIRENVDDLTRAKNIINSLQVKLDQREKSLEVFNKQETDLAGLLFQKHLVGESLLQERQQIVGFLEEKVRENDELKKIRDSLAQNLESKSQVLTEMEATYRALETKLEVRSNELEVIMEDRNKAVREVENKIIELTKLKEERDSLVTLMNGKQSEKDQEISKLLSRLKSSQHDLALTKKVLEAKKEANEKAIKLASVTQEEITAKRKAVDGLKDRIKWLQDSLQATAEEKVYFENKASELSSQLRDKNQENENIRTELDQMMKYYDNANGQVNQMEMALEKAGIKFSESQALVERLEQDLVKIKLQYSLEVKELEMKVRSVEGRGQHVQVVKPFRFQDGCEARLPRCPDNVMPSTKELDATKQRLTDEAEMTEGFKTLLNDLHELMSNIKDSSVMLRRGGNVAETNIATAKGGSNVATKNIPTAKDVVPDTTEHRKTTATAKESGNKSSRCRDGKISTDSEASTVPSVTLREQPSNPSKNRGTEYKKKSSSCVNAPLHSSSPKSSSPVFDNDPCNDYTTQFDSDISDVEYDLSEGKQERTAELRNESSTSSKPRKLKSVQQASRLKEKIDSYVEPEDVDSLLMPQELPPRSHRRAKKILDLLHLKGQELTNGNKKIAELISRQDDGIKRCREAEQTIKEILK
ncbi:Hypothetical predicted protein [Paramuricea clavata]|uniref:Uncharacterized protein n=1 Tax=Paramuricea clavata TaxID=317549 RepID=A0A6S7GWS2_PARCT|nr:Hypothetical predicted protein [Paramuricea clavata]